MNFRDNSGMASFAVFLFAVVALLILAANFKLASAVRITTDGYDEFNSQTVEKNGIALIVKESILAVGETAISPSGNTVATEIGHRLQNLIFPAGVSVTLQTAPASLPNCAFFPAAAPPTAALPYFSGTGSQWAGRGALTSSLGAQGPVADLGSLTFGFQRLDSAATAEVRTYTVAAGLISVPLTNVDLVAYGLPATGAVPASSPPLPAGMLGPGVSQLVATSNNPAGDPTACPDLYAGSGPDTLPYEFRNATSFSWNAYEYVWSSGYQHSLIAVAQTEADPGNAAPTADNPSPATGAVYDFSAAQNPAIAGVTASGSAIAIDCSQVQSTVIAVIDSEGTGSVSIQGSPASGAPFVLLVRNTAGILGRTSVTFTGSNVRPVLLYLENCAAVFSGRPQFSGGLFLDRATVVNGGVDWTGSISFYALASPLSGWNLTLSDSPAIKAALAAVAPRALLVSTSATR